MGINLIRILGPVGILAAISFYYFNSVPQSESLNEPKPTDDPKGKAASSRNQVREQKLIYINVDPKHPIEGNLVEQYFNQRQNQFIVRRKYVGDNTPKDYFLLWTHYHWDVNYRNFISGGSQLINHNPNAKIYDDKNQLFQMLTRMDMKRLYGDYNSSAFIPLTFTFDIATDNISAEEKRLFNLPNKSGVWIAKNPNACCGKGLKLISNLEEFLAEIKAWKLRKGNKEEFRYRQIQQYMEKPLLIEGRKAEYRAFVLILSSQPEVILFHQGFMKKAVNQFSSDLNDLFAHLTNLAEAKKYENFEEISKKTYMHPEQLEEYLKANFNLDDQGIEDFYHRMKKAITYTLEAGLEFLTQKTGFFQTFAVDFIFDDKLNPFLLEINQPYAIQGSLLPGYREIVPEFINNSLDLVLKTYKDPSQSIQQKLADLSPKDYAKNFDVLYNIGKNFTYLNKDSPLSFN